MLSTSLLPAHLLEIEGPDAASFLHSQLSSQVQQLAAGQWQASAWLDPQGRARYLLQLARVGPQQFVLLLRGGEAGSLLAALRPFVFRSKLSLRELPVQTIRSGPALALHELQSSPDGTELSWGFGDHCMITGGDGNADLDWLQPQLEQGWSWLPASALGVHLGAALGLLRLGAIAIDKGCYPGQEIVARLHFRGGLKRHLALLQAEKASPAGAPLQAGHTLVGHSLHPLAVESGQYLLAVLDDDQQADGFRLTQRWQP